VLNNTSTGLADAILEGQSRIGPKIGSKSTSRRITMEVFGPQAGTC